MTERDQGYFADELKQAYPQFADIGRHPRTALGVIVPVVASVARLYDPDQIEEQFYGDQRPNHVEDLRAYATALTHSDNFSFIDRGLMATLLGTRQEGLDRVVPFPDSESLHRVYGLMRAVIQDDRVQTGLRQGLKNTDEYDLVRMLMTRLYPHISLQGLEWNTSHQLEAYAPHIRPTLGFISRDLLRSHVGSKRYMLHMINERVIGVDHSSGENAYLSVYCPMGSLESIDRITRRGSARCA